jgi:hypothetical protein
MRFSIRDLLWLMAVVAIGCLFVAERQRYLSRIGELQSQNMKLASEAQKPRSVTIGQNPYTFPPGMQRAVVEFRRDGSLSVRYEPIDE